MDIFLAKRACKHWWQRRTRGWDDTELWSLDYTIAKFTLPRLIEYRETVHSYPYCEDIPTPEAWEDALDDMIFGLSFVVDDFDNKINYESYDWERKNRGMELFGKYFNALWS